MKTHSTFGKALIIAFISLIAVSAASAKGKKYGLFVGINAYQGGINPLKGCGQQRGRSFGRGQFAVGRAICPREQPLAGRFRIDPKSVMISVSCRHEVECLSAIDRFKEPGV